MKRFFTWPRVIAGSIVLLAWSAWYIPRASEGMFRDRLVHELEEGLGRKVEISTTWIRVVPTPGFVVSDVRISEDPAIGAEPMAVIKTLVALPAWGELLGGRFAVGSVRLEDDTSLNVTRIDDGAGGVRWNLASLGAKSGSQPGPGVKPGTEPGTQSGRAFPAVHMSLGRINFKSGDTKSIYYLLDTDVDLSPGATPGSPLKIEVSGEPARTDKPSRGFGSFVAKGQWNPADHSVELDVKLEKSELNDLLSLFEGTESSLLGTVWGEAHLAGPMAKIGIAGQINVSELHGWNHAPPGGSAWPLAIGGVLNVADQVIELQASAKGNPSPFGARLRVASYLGRPRWAGTVSLNGIPVAPLTGIARNFGIALPSDLALDGVAQGSIGYSVENNAGMAGQVRVSGATLAAQGAPPLKIPQADVRFSGTSIALAPSSIVNDAGESAEIEGSYDTASGALQASLTSDGMAIASLRRQVSIAGAPLIGLATAGSWSGSLHYQNTEVGWTGSVHLKDPDIPFEAFAQPVHVVDADATIDAGGVQMKRLQLTLGGMSAQGEYRYDAGAKRPHRFRITVPTASAGDLEAMLAPTLRRAGFLSYAFNFGRVPEPDWLRDMHAEGVIQFGTLTVGGTVLNNVKTSVIWDGTEVTLPGLAARVNDAGFTGDAAIHLAARQPRYEVNGSLAGLNWRGGTLDASVTLATSGTGTDLLTNLHAEGAFRGKKLDIAPPDEWDSAEGRFDLGWAKTNPKLRLSPLTVQSGGNKWTGGAETQDSGQIVVKLADGVRRMEASGALLKGEALKVAQ